MPQLAILQKEVQDFINKNLKADLPSLILKGSPFEKVSIQEIVSQIESKHKAKEKLPTWFAAKNIVYPPRLNLEQTSSEITAKHKAKLVYGKVIDLTGGFGIDTHFFCKNAEQVWHCEINASLSAIAKHNNTVLNPACTINFQAIDGLGFLKNSSIGFDCIYIDPSRRAKDKKVFLLEDSLPNIIDNLEWIANKCQCFLLKTSPLLDINRTLSQLKWVKEIHIVAVKNEVKELLWLIELKNKDKPKLKTFNYKTNGVQKFSSALHSKTDKIEYSKPLSFLYEPNAAIMKSGCFEALGKDYKLKKLASNSHLYTSESLIKFPGRKFKVVKSLPFSKKAVKSLGLKKANITTRNFILSVEQIRKKFKIKDGGTDYLFFTTTKNDEKQVLQCKKV